MTELHFDEAAHRYTLGDRVLPSVTQVLQPIAPDFSMVPPDVLEAKRQLGTAVHLACELDDEGDLDEDTLPDSLRPYLAAWRLFKADTGLLVIANELRLHDAGQFAGTLDRYGEFAGDRWVLDLKTAADPAPSYGPQLAAYSHLAIANGLHPQQTAAPRRATVHLRPDGTYRMHEFKRPNDWPAFVACLALWNWKELTK